MGKIKDSCQEPSVIDWWHEDASLSVVLEHTQNSTKGSNFITDEENSDV